MKKLLCILSALAVLIVSGCSAKPSEAPIFEKYVAEGTNYPVKIVWHTVQDGIGESETIDTSSTYYIASPDKFYMSEDFEGSVYDSLYNDGVFYNMIHEEKTAFSSALSDEEREVCEEIIGYIPSNPEKWVLTEKGEAQYEGKTYLYETASLDDMYFLTVYADPETNNIEYVSSGQGGAMHRLTELTHSFDLRIFDIPEDYEIVRIPGVK